MTFGELKVGDKFRCFNFVSGKVDRSLPAYTKVKFGWYKPGQAYTATPRYGRRLERIAFVHVKDDTKVEIRHDFTRTVRLLLVLWRNDLLYLKEFCS